MFYKSVFIHENRIFPDFPNKVKNISNIKVIIMIIKRKTIKKKKWIKRKDNS